MNMGDIINELCLPVFFMPIYKDHENGRHWADDSQVTSKNHTQFLPEVKGCKWVGILRFHPIVGSELKYGPNNVY